MLERSTYYILDAQGQQLIMYEHIVDSSEVKYHLAERNVYGSLRLGTTRDTVNLYDPQLLPSYGVLGNRNYELSNQLGNVLTVITDHVVPLDEDLNEEVDGYQVSLAMVADYSPFGVQLDGRTDENTGYRYGFNGMEIDHQVKGNGNSYTTEFRQYDPRLARWSSIDPLMTKYPFYSPYSTLNNNPLRFTDRLGLEGQDWIGKKDSKGNTTWEWRAEVDGPDKLPPGYTEYKKPGGKYKSNGREVQLGSGPNDWKYTDQKPNGNYTNQQGMDIQWSGEDQANVEFKMKIRGLEQALDNLKLALGATFATPFVAGAAILTAPAWGPIALQGLRMTGQYSWQGLKFYHNTFGKTGGYVNAFSDVGMQMLANPSENVNFYSPIVAGLLPGNNLKTIAAFEISTTFVTVDSKGVRLEPPSNAGIFDVMTSKMWGAWGTTMGSQTEGLFLDAGTKAISGKLRQDEEK